MSVGFNCSITVQQRKIVGYAGNAFFGIWGICLVFIFGLCKIQSGPMIVIM